MIMAKNTIQNKENYIEFDSEPLYSDIYYLVYGVGSSMRVADSGRSKSLLIDVASDLKQLYPDRNYKVVKVRTISEIVCSIS